MKYTATGSSPGTPNSRYTPACHYITIRATPTSDTAPPTKSTSKQKKKKKTKKKNTEFEPINHQ